MFCKECKKAEKSLQRTGGTWVTKPFTNWKKASEKMKAHSQSDIRTCSGLPSFDASRKGGKRGNNHATAARQHIAHNTIFEKLVSLVVACGGEDLKTFLESGGKNAMYTSRIAVTEFIEALGTWVEVSLLKHLHQATFYSIMADECTDVSSVEELSLFC